MDQLMGQFERRMKHLIEQMRQFLDAYEVTNYIMARVGRVVPIKPTTNGQA